MAYISTAALGDGTGPSATDIVVKDFDLKVSNMTKEDTPILNMAMSKQVSAKSTNHGWAQDIYRTPQMQAVQEGAVVSPDNAPGDTRYNLSNYTQIFQTTIAVTNTADAVKQAGGPASAYQEPKQLQELNFDVELQLLRQDQFGTKYAGQAGKAGGATGTQQIGRRTAGLHAFAGTLSYNPTGTTITRNVNNTDTDVAVSTTDSKLNVAADGTNYYTGTFTNQLFGPILYKQLVTVAEGRYNAKVMTVMSPLSVRTSISDLIGNSNTGINRRNVEAGDVISTYEGDFNYTYSFNNSWIMDINGTANDVIYFINPAVVRWATLRKLMPNTGIAPNADGTLRQFIMEGALQVDNPAGIACLQNISVAGTAQSATAQRSSNFVQRVNVGNGNSY